MELGGILLVPQLSWLHSVLQSSMVVLAMLSLRISLETLVQRRYLALIVLGVDSGAGGLSKRLAEEVLRLNLRDVASVPGDVLSLQVLGWTAQPVLALL